MSKICGVYCWTHTPSGRRYVGSSLDCEKRRRRHLSAARKPNPTCFPRQIATLGANSFAFEIIEICLLHERLAREAYHIAALGTLVPNGFNIHEDPTKGPSYCWTQDMRAARSAWNKARMSPEVRAAASAKSKTQWASPEARAAQSKRTKAYLATPEGQAKAAAQMKACLHTAKVRAILSERAKAQFSTSESRAAASARTTAFHVERRARDETTR